MLVQVEDLLRNEVRAEEFCVANFAHLVQHIEGASQLLPYAVRVLAHHRSRFVEVWSGDGQLLIARYTPISN